MAIQRAAPMPLPGDELAEIRARLAPQYGAEVWDGDERRVLVIRVPHAQPDPVNDVEAAVEYLDPALVEDVTHAIMVGEASAAQVYASPLRQLMQERVALDKRLAASWRETLPPHLAHAAFQSPEDPRRRWRLAVRLPCARIQDMDEEMLEDLADGIGPELDTPRFKHMAAVYLIAAEDDVRIEPATFFPEMREKWQDEERRRIQEEERMAREAEEKARREREHRALLRDLEARVGRRPAERPEVRHVHSRIDTLGQAPARGLEDVAADVRTRLEGAHEYLDDVASALTPGLLAEEDATPAIRPAGTPAAAPIAAGPSPASPSPASPSPPPPSRTGQPRARARDGPVTPDRPPSLGAPSSTAREGPAAAPSTTTTAAIDTASTTVPGLGEAPPSRKQRQMDDLRSRVDRVIAHEPRPPGHLTRLPEARYSAVGTDVTHDLRTTVPEAPTRAPETVEEVLAAAGFDMLRDPETPGHTIDIAAERPQGDPQRLVVRKVGRLDTATAKELLKTARELDVDLVLCIAEHIEPEGQRILVATKVQVLRPDQVRKLQF